MNCCQAAMAMILIPEQTLHHHVPLLAFLLLSSSTFLFAQPSFYNINSIANLSTSWINHPSFWPNSISSQSHLIALTPILTRETIDGSYPAPTFFCGFYCNLYSNFSDSADCIFGVFISQEISGKLSPQLVWSANRNHPVQLNATLLLSPDGDLILTDSDGKQVWSSGTGGKSVAGMNLTENGNLLLFGRNNEPVWQSFDHPTDSLLLGQRLMRGQRLTASVSPSNQSEGLFYFSLDNAGFGAHINSDPPQSYYMDNRDLDDLPYAELTSGSFDYFVFPPAAARFMRLEPDGHLKVFRWGGSDWTEVADLLMIMRSCDYPMVCGRYGFCSEGQCSCPETTGGRHESLFTETTYRQPKFGCSLLTQISCDHSEDHSLLELKNAYYFAFHFNNQVQEETSQLEDCKNRCLSNCSCKAALFVTDHDGSSTNGSCLLVDEVFSIANNENFMASYYNTTLYIKVQHPYEHVEPLYSRRKIAILASSLATILWVLSLVGSCLFVFSRRIQQWEKVEVEDFTDDVPVMAATRYSYENLKVATEGFNKKLGEGGFGSVYEGTLSDGTKIAVKCLDGLAKVKDSFLVEVKTIGSIHHVNLVKLMGYCFEKSHRLLVYEYMANRSLEGWIFLGEENHGLPWLSRRKIISDIAKGLAYLHEECSQKIIHLDIKPQNILLDHNFNAKISDFGLSKLIEKDQSQVVTRMRGTPGYMAPEWLSSVINEKVDVYSFGIVMLEIICGRKNVDWSKTEEEKHLLSIFKTKVEEQTLEELVDDRSEDMQNHIEEAVEMMKIAAWCLQSDFSRRPSMSLVVKVLEGLVEVETNLDYNFLNPRIARKNAASELLPSALSGPR